MLTQRRKGRGELCPFVLLSKIVAHRLRRTTQTLCETLRLCVRRKYLLLSKKLHTAQKYTEICFACFCESLRRLRETITLRRDSVYSVSSV